MSPFRWGVRGFGLFVAMILVVSFVLTVVLEADWPPLGVEPILATIGGVLFVSVLILVGTAVPAAIAIFLVYLLGRRLGESSVVFIGPAMLLLAIVPMVLVESSLRVASTLAVVCIGQVLVGLFLTRSFPKY